MVGMELSRARTRSATCISPSWWGQRVEEQGSQSSRGLVGAVAPSSTVALRRQLRENSLGCLVMLDDHWEHMFWLCGFAYRYRVSLCSPGWPQTQDPAGVTGLCHHHTWLRYLMIMLELIAIFCAKWLNIKKNYIPPPLCVCASACVYMSTMVCHAEAKGQLAEFFFFCFVLLLRRYWGSASYFQAWEL